MNNTSYVPADELSGSLKPRFLEGILPYCPVERAELPIMVRRRPRLTNDSCRYEAIQGFFSYFSVFSDCVPFDGDLTFYSPNTNGVNFNRSVFAIDGNGHYIFTTTEMLLAYALAGLNSEDRDWRLRSTGIRRRHPRAIRELKSGQSV